jgi:hypothetical protein
MQFLHWAFDTLARRYVFPDGDYFVVSLTEPPSEGSPIVFVSVTAIWQQYSLQKKFGALVARKWTPSNAELSDAARPVLLDQFYGTTDDAGEAILDLMIDHWQMKRSYDHLTEHDQRRADAIRAYTVATRQRFQGLKSSPPLNLRLLRRSPLMCTFVNPMMLKVPVTSLQFFVDIHVHFAFNEIRRSEHPHADDVIALIYDVLFLQQKTAVTLKSLLEHIVQTARKDSESILVQSEIDAIIAADLLFIYEKATVEKTVALVGHTLGLSLEDKKSHKKRVDALRAALPESALHTPYGSLLLSFVSSEALDRLNARRSGLLHKMGIADLQPHNYVGAGGEDNALQKLFSFLHEQHAKNTLIILAALALLTDDLMRRDPPDVVPLFVTRIHSTILDAVEQMLADSPDPQPLAD